MGWYRTFKNEGELSQPILRKNIGIDKILLMIKINNFYKAFFIEGFRNMQEKLNYPTSQKREKSVQETFS